MTLRQAVGWIAASANNRPDFGVVFSGCNGSNDPAANAVFVFQYQTIGSKSCESVLGLISIF